MRTSFRQLLRSPLALTRNGLAMLGKSFSGRIHRGRLRRWQREVELLETRVMLAAEDPSVFHFPVGDPVSGTGWLHNYNNFGENADSSRRGHLGSDFDYLPGSIQSGDQPVRAVAPGIVTAVGPWKNVGDSDDNPGNGWFVILEHFTDNTALGTNYYSFYGHMNKEGRPAIGETIDRGQVVGTVWRDFPGGGDHLHFEIRFNKDGGTTAGTDPGPGYAGSPFTGASTVTYDDSPASYPKLGSPAARQDIVWVNPEQYIDASNQPALSIQDMRDAHLFQSVDKATGTVMIAGSDRYSDSITLDFDNGNLFLRLTSEDPDLLSKDINLTTIPDFNRVFIDTGGGDDIVDFRQDIFQRAVTVYAGDGNDIVLTGNGKDLILGESGDDWIEGGGNADWLFGGTGDDVIFGFSSARGIFSNSDPGDRIYGENGNDKIFDFESVTADGGAGTNTIKGNGFSLSDIPYGIAGKLIAVGSAGNTTIAVSQASGPVAEPFASGTLTLIEVDGHSRLLSNWSANARQPVFGSIVVLSGAGNDIVDLSSSPIRGIVDVSGGNDVVHGSRFNDVIRGGAGNDELKGGAGRDSIGGHQGVDRIDGELGDDFVYGGDDFDDDFVFGGAGSDYIDAPRGDSDDFDPTIDDLRSNFAGNSIIVDRFRVASIEDTPDFLHGAAFVSVERGPIPQSVSTSAPGISEFTLSSNVITEGESLYALLRTDGTGSWARMTIFADTNGNGRYDNSTDQRLYRSRGRTLDYRGQLRTSSLSPGTYQVRALLEAYNGTSTLSSALTLTVLEEQMLPAPPALPDHLDIASDEPMLVIPNRNGDVTVPANELAGMSQIDLYEYRVGTSGGHGFSVAGVEGVIGLYDANGDLIDGPAEGTTLVTNLTAGLTYYIAVAGRNGATGTYSLVITGRNQVTQGTISTPPGNYAGTGMGTFSAGASVHFWGITAPATATLLDVDVSSVADNPLWVRVADTQNNVIGFADLGRPGSERILRNLPVDPGQTYYITVHGLYEMPGDYSVTADFYPDDVGLPATIVPTTALANYQPLIVQADGDYSLPGQQIASSGEFKYFHVAPSFSGDFIIRTTGNTDTLLGVYTGNGAQLLAQSDNDADALNGQVQVSLNGGDEYWVVVRGVGNTTGSFGVEVFGPDQAASVIPIGGLANQGTDSFFVGVTSSRQEYFQFTAPIGTDTAFIQVEATDPGSRPLDIVWFIEDSQGNITTVDSGGVNVAEILNSFAVVGGETYSITVTSKDRAPGPGRVTLDLGPDGVGSGEFVATTSFFNNQSQPRVAMNTSGRSVVVWTRNAAQGATGSDLDDDIFFQIFDASGQPVGSELRANADDPQIEQNNPDIGIASDGSFWVGWHDYGADFNDPVDDSIRIRKFSALGSALTSEINVGFTGVYELAVAVHDDGSLAVLGSDGRILSMRTFSSTGVATSSVLTVDDPPGTKDVLHPSIAPALNGGYVAAWTREGTTYGIIAQRFDSVGNKVNAEIVVASSSLSQFAPAIETNASGNFAVAFYQFDNDGTGSNVYFQRFTSAGAATGTLIRANEFLADGQDSPDLELKDDGSVVVLWTSENQDGNDLGVFFRQFDPSGSPTTTTENQLNSYTMSRQEHSAIATTGGDLFFATWESDGQDGSGDSVIALRFTLPSPPPQPIVAVTESAGVANDLVVPFGNVAQFSAFPVRVIRIENTGTATLTGQLSLSGPGSAAYSFDGSSVLSLDPGMFRDVTVTMATNVRGQFGAELVIDHNAVGSQTTVILDGQVSPAADPQEVNNTDETATDLGTIANANLSGLSLHINSDVDWFRFTVATYSEVTISTIFTHSEGDIDLFVYDRNLGIRALSASSTDNEQVVFILDSNEEAYVLIAGNGAVSNVYDLTIQAVAQPRPEVHLTETGGTTEVSEDGATDTYSLVLNAAPLSDVQIELFPDNQLDLGMGPGNPVTLMFTSMNWDTPQDVTVSAPNDGQVEGSHMGKITHLVVSGDGRYDGYVLSDVTVSIVDANLPPQVSLANTLATLPEDAVTSPRIKVADIVVTDDGLGTNSLSLSGNDSSLFEIVGTELFLIAGTALDYETNPSLDVTVNVNDATIAPNPNDSDSLSIAITDVNEAPTVSLTPIVTTLAENATTTPRIKVADIFITDDALGTNVLSLSGADASLFEIAGTELFLIAGTALDFETNPSLDVTVNVNDATIAPNPNDSDSLSIAITDVNEAPTVALTVFVTSLAENTPSSPRIKVANILVTDDGLGSNVLSLSGTNAAFFELAGSELFLKDGVVLDFETTPVLNVTVNVNDPTVGGSPDDSDSMTITLLDRVEADVVLFDRVTRTSLVAVSQGYSFNFETGPDWSTTGVQNVYQGDFNGDGRTDIAGVSSGGAFYVSLNSPSGLTNPVLWANIPFGNLSTDLNVGDFNGDGLTDFLSRGIAGHWFIQRSTGNSFTQVQGPRWSVDGWKDGEAVIGDFNGDGKDDVALRREVAPGQQNANWFIGYGTETSLITAFGGAWNESIYSWNDIRVGDFNGDGRDDIIARTHLGAWFALQMPSGNRLQMRFAGKWNPDYSWRDVSVGDFNGDGKDDIVGWEQRGLWWAIEGSMTSSPISFYGAWSRTASWQATVGDWNGDGLDDIIGFNRTTGASWGLLSNGSRFGVTDYFGMTTGSLNWSLLSDEFE